MRSRDGLRITLTGVKVGWWNPFGVAVFELAGAPAAAGDEFVVQAAAQGQVVDVSGAARGVVGDVVDSGQVARHIAVGK